GTIPAHLRMQLLTSLSPAKYALLPPRPAAPAPAASVAPSVTSAPAMAVLDAVAPSSTSVTVVHDTTPPTVDKIEVVLFPDDPAKRRVVPLGSPGLFIGMQNVLL